MSLPDDEFSEDEAGEVSEDITEEPTEQDEAPDEAPDAEEETYRQRYENLRKLENKRDNEISELRKFREQVEPLLQQVQQERQAREAPPEDPRAAAARPIAQRKFDKLLAAGYTHQEATEEAWDYALDIVDAAGGIADRKVAELQPSFDRMGRGVIAEDVTAILAEANIDGVTYADLREAIKDVSVRQWQETDEVARQSSIIVLAKAIRSDKIDAGTYVPKGKARPKDNGNPDVDVPRSSAKVLSGELAQAATFLDEVGVELPTERIRAAYERAKGRG